MKKTEDGIECTPDEMIELNKPLGMLDSVYSHNPEKCNWQWGVCATHAILEVTNAHKQEIRAFHGQELTDLEKQLVELL
jgi:hypothetical protein